MKRLLWSALVWTAFACSEEPPPQRFDDDEQSSSQGGTTQVTGSGGMLQTTSTGGGGGNGGSTSSGTTTMCDDPGPEPNETEGTATDLGPLNDCDSQMMTHHATGVLAGNDVDWLKYSGSDVGLCSVDPARVINADGQVMVCKYLECAAGTATVTCDSGSPDVSPGGLDGCCGQSSVAVTLNCVGPVSDDATVYLRITKPSSFDCVSYSLDVHY